MKSFLRNSTFRCGHFYWLALYTAYQHAAQRQSSSKTISWCGWVSGWIGFNDPLGHISETDELIVLVLTTKNKQTKHYIRPTA